jgi:hypothetical protein
MPKPLEGASITGHDSPLNVAIDSKGGAAATVTLTTSGAAQKFPEHGSRRHPLGVVAPLEGFCGRAVVVDERQHLVDEVLA